MTDHGLDLAIIGNGRSDAIAVALSMPFDDRRERHQNLFKNLSKNEVKHWDDRFIRALKQTASELVAA